MLGFASTAMASWELLLPLFTFVMVDGGTADLFWGFIVAACGMSLVYASIAEMASMCVPSYLNFEFQLIFVLITNISES